MDSVFAVHSKHGIIGNELMLEHLHPNSDGYFLMGKEFSSAILDHGLIEPINYRRLAQDRDDNYYRTLSCLTQLDEAIARFAVRILTSQWPFSNSDMTVIPQPTNRVEQVALEYMKGEMAWWEAHDRLGTEAAKEKNYEDALGHYRAIAKAMPFFDYPYLAIGRLFKIQSRYKEAEEAFWRALGIRISQVAYVRLSELAVLQKNPDAALRHLEKAIELNSIIEPKLTATELAEAAYLTAFAYGLQGNEELAKSEIRKSLIYDSNYGPAKEAAQQLGLR
jgi:tetratricopeptide (TPR) repeat protein